eukprot:Rhum_TRINITY_DN3375_c0_g2::Rhum_TRINITY_DN3375_c0_g2_i1::g.10489::m.10489
MILLYVLLVACCGLAEELPLQCTDCSDPAAEVLISGASCELEGALHDKIQPGNGLLSSYAILAERLQATIVGQDRGVSVLNHYVLRWLRAALSSSKNIGGGYVLVSKKFRGSGLTSVSDAIRRAIAHADAGSRHVCSPLVLNGHWDVDILLKAIEKYAVICPARENLWWHQMNAKSLPSLIIDNADDFFASDKGIAILNELPARVFNEGLVVILGLHPDARAPIMKHLEHTRMRYKELPFQNLNGLKEIEAVTLHHLKKMVCKHGLPSLVVKNIASVTNAVAAAHDGVSGARGVVTFLVDSVEPCLRQAPLYALHDEHSLTLRVHEGKWSLVTEE